MPLRLRSAGGGGVTLKPPVALSTEAAIEVPAYDGAKMLTDLSPGALLGITTIRSSTRTTYGSLPNTYIYFGGSFTKKKADSVIIATCTVFGAQFDNGNCCAGLQLDSAWDYGCAYQYDGAWSNTQQTTIVVGSSQWTGISAGGHTMSFGHNGLGSQTGGIFKVLNPNSSDDVRNRQMTSSIVVYEVMP